MVYLRATLAGFGAIIVVIMLSIVLLMSQTRTAGMGAVVAYTVGNPLFWLACVVAFGLGFWFTAKPTP